MSLACCKGVRQSPVMLRLLVVCAGVHSSAVSFFPFDAHGVSWPPQSTRSRFTDQVSPLSGIQWYNSTTALDVFDVYFVAYGSDYRGALQTFTTIMGQVCTLSPMPHLVACAALLLCAPTAAFGVCTLGMDMGLVLCAAFTSTSLRVASGAWILVVMRCVAPPPVF